MWRGTQIMGFTDTGGQAKKRWIQLQNFGRELRHEDWKSTLTHGRRKTSSSRQAVVGVSRGEWRQRTQTYPCQFALKPRFIRMLQRILSKFRSKKDATTFQFRARWKEELVVTGTGGEFVLEMPMGVLSLYFPTESVWKERGPNWAKFLWPVLREELAQWRRQNDANFVMDDTATVTFR